VTLKRYGVKRDLNELGIVRGLRQIGCRILRLDPVDLLCLHHGRLWLIEVKTPTSRTRRTQQQKTLTEEGWPIHYVTSLPEAIAVVQKKCPEDVVETDKILKGLGS
jgi:hypothetical protein